MMVTPTSSEVNRVNAVAPSTVVQSHANPGYSSSSQLSQNRTSASSTDSVKISGPAQARSLFQSGRSVDQIALQLGLDADVVRSYLGLMTESSLTRTTQSIDSMNNLMKLANSGPSVDMLIGYLGSSSKESGANTMKMYDGLA